MTNTNMKFVYKNDYEKKKILLFSNITITIVITSGNFYIVCVFILNKTSQVNNEIF